MDDKEEKKSFYYEVPEEWIDKAAAAINKQLEEKYKSVKITATHTKNDDPYYITQEKIYKGPWPAIVTEVYDGSEDNNFTINKYTVQDNLITIETVAPNKEWIDQYFFTKNNEFKVETSFCIFKDCHFFEYSGLNVKFRCKKEDYIGKPYFPYKDINMYGPTNNNKIKKEDNEKKKGEIFTFDVKEYMDCLKDQVIKLYTVPELDLGIPSLKLKGDGITNNKATIQDKVNNIKGSVDFTVTNPDEFDWSPSGKSNYYGDECKVKVVTLPKSSRILKCNQFSGLLFDLISYRKVYYSGNMVRIANIFIHVELNERNQNFINYLNANAAITIYNTDIFFRGCKLVAYNPSSIGFILACERVEASGETEILVTETDKPKEMVRKKEPANDLLVDLIDV